ncbi:MAG TPA: UDP-N-acetylmuramoyl-L-alanyl-D-glutamate--2,6-diaminopimelate ligase, partial [Syntrophales bacterium]|nr:UDP-N-acetylmuramoyl-L-alanyl-D-glutamate--2,6-diaminopimelate ligase [Syntrophales bacterium]
MKLTELIRGLDIVAVKGDRGLDVVDICYDSRRCREGSLFVAVSGLKHDGHDYIGQAVCNGAAAVVLEKEVAVPAGVAAVRVRDSRRTLGLLGRRFFRNPSGSLCVVGVTGTSGKTTLTFLLESIFREAGSSVGVLGTVNYRFGGKTMPAPNTTPESLDLQRILREMADSGVQNVVMEVSSHALAQHRVDDCEFDIGVFTNLSSEHMDYHKTMEEYFLAKRRLFDTLLDGRKGNRRWRMVVNVDDPWGKRLLGEVGAEAVTFGMDPAADVTCEDASFSLEGIRAAAKTPAGRVMIRSGMIGRFNLSNILAAVAASYALDVPTEAVEAGIRKATGIPGRLEKVGDDGDPSVFVDYAHKEAALRAVLENLSPFKEGR